MADILYIYCMKTFCTIIRRCLYVTQLPGSVKNLISQSVYNNYYFRVYGEARLDIRGMYEMNCLFLSGDFKFQVRNKQFISNIPRMLQAPYSSKIDV